MVTMSLEAIVAEILATTAVETLSQLTRLVEGHYAYTGKSRGSALSNRIRARYPKKWFIR
jgi:Uri superfamily endonuclease